MRHLYLFLFTFIFCTVTQAQVIKYVKPNAPTSGNGNSVANAYNDIVTAVKKTEQAGGGTLYIIDGNYNMGSSKITIKTAATAATAVTIKPQTTAGVKLTFTGTTASYFHKDSRYITLEGLELYGKTDVLDYWTIVSKGFWDKTSVIRNGGTAVKLDGQYITIKDCHIHDWYQKAVEINNGRYVIMQGNIIHDIATTSLSGGHGSRW